VEKNNDLRAFLRSDRPSIERSEFNETYRRTRISVSALIALASLVMSGRFDYRPYVISGIVLGCLLVIAHAYLRRSSPLLEMVSVDTALYLGMTLLADLPEVAIFVGMAQSFIVFFFVPIRIALITTGVFTLAGIIATAISIVSQVQLRSSAETVSIVTSVTVITIVPAAWTLLRAGSELHAHRAKEERLIEEKDHLLLDKDRFVASVSHELRTPLTAVVGLAHTLAEARNEITPGERDEFIGMIVEQSEEVAAIVDDLLVAARAGTGHLSLVVSELALGVEVDAVISGHFELLNIETAPILVVGDPIRVRQCCAI
jgi:signal transduction histidine kinase